MRRFWVVVRNQSTQPMKIIESEANMGVEYPTKTTSSDEVSGEEGDKRGAETDTSNEDVEASEGDEEEAEGDGKDSVASDNDKLGEVGSGTEMEAEESSGGGRKKRERNIEEPDVSDLPRKRVQKNPERFGFTPAKENTMPRERKGIYMPLALVAPEKRNKFLKKLRSGRTKDYIVNEQAMKNDFFKPIYTLTSHVDTNHMEALLSLVWRRGGETLLAERVAVLDTWFTHMLGNEHKRFQNTKRKAPFPLNIMLKKYVRGIVPSRPGKLAWITDVDLVYAPMHWGKSTLGCCVYQSENRRHLDL